MGPALLTGTFFRVLDDKHRFAVPKPIREALGFPEQTVLFLAPGTDGSLALYDQEAFSRLAEQLSGSSPNGPEVRAFSRLFYSQAQRIEIDRSGRLRVPAELAALAGLRKEVVLIGVRDHLEVWDRGLWETYLQGKQPQYDEIADQAFAGQAVTPARPEPRPAQPR